MKSICYWITGIAGVIIFCSLITGFHDFLKRKHYESIELTEIGEQEWQAIYPTPHAIWLIRKKCPNEMGKLGTFLECRQAVLEGL